MGQQVLSLMRLILPLALEHISVKSPFVYDLLPETGETVHQPSAWNLYSPGPTVWDWSLQDANGTTWKWEVAQGTWETWFWKADRPASDHGGGFRMWQMAGGVLWAELSWVRADPDTVRWFCRLRQPDRSQGESRDTVADLQADAWKVRSGEHTWGLVKRRSTSWSFCTDEVCIPLEEQSCNHSVRAVRLDQPGGVDAVEWEVGGGDYRVVNVRLRRDVPGVRLPRDVASFFSDMLDSVMSFFRRLFGGDSGRSGEDSSILRLISAILGLFASAEVPARDNQTQLVEELL